MSTFLSIGACFEIRISCFEFEAKTKGPGKLLKSHAGEKATPVQCNYFFTGSAFGELSCA
jgi:hypothetical protein